LLAVFALCLRLAWPGGAVAPSPNPDLAFAAALGEHALCLAAATGAEKAPLPRDQEPAGPSDHADHEGLGCCLWHAATSAALPRSPTVAPIIFPERAVGKLARAAPRPSSHLIGPHQARAPPAIT